MVREARRSSPRGHRVPRGHSGAPTRPGGEEIWEVRLVSADVARLAAVDGRTPVELDLKGKAAPVRALMVDVNA